ncbi:hypothetical protein SAMN04487910_2758 [Aquimarina amphilecti]|uniref:Uncharacterized protein n=1 Tax=Aquimarina amphilecti TaxID=1038014 RepID=A0A1H7R137_AQUAM|nr:hypothetical protein [Aquimarina amphilecti]SEL54001.1 hypothetical protein SAMN04487910_2758 [Aquimarina amphilecti]
MKSKGLQFWYFLIEGNLDDKTGAYGNFYTYGERCGEALGNTYLIAQQEGIINPTVIETTRLDNLEEFELPEEAEQVSDSTYMIPSLNTFELNPKEYFFKPPTGISFDTIIGEYDSELILEQFVAYNKNENGVYELQLVVDKNRLVEIFFKCFDLIEPIDAFWIYICEHWLNRGRELWASKSVINKNEIIKFLKKHKTNTIENGFVELVVNSNTGKTNLMLCEHKKVQLHTESEEVFKNFIGGLIDLGFEQTKDFYNIEFGYHHWHYRPIESLDRDDFAVLLIDNEFENIKLEK